LLYWYKSTNTDASLVPQARALLEFKARESEWGAMLDGETIPSGISLAVC
jgi:hypothetical protein